MKRIGVSMRVDYVSTHDERRDAIDQAWSGTLLTMGYLPVPLPNIDKRYVESLVSDLRLEGVVLTGGNSLGHLEEHEGCKAPERDSFEIELLALLQKRKLPVIGVCRGMQVINYYFGGTLSKIDRHIATKHAIQSVHESFVLPNEVNSYHSWGIRNSDLASELVPIAKDLSGNIEAFVDNDETLLGIMWHPERELYTNELDVSLFKKILK